MMEKNLVRPKTLIGIDGSTAQLLMGIWRGCLAGEETSPPPGGRSAIGAYQADASARLSQVFLSQLDQCLAELPKGLSEVDALIVSLGPGSFTGTRLTAAIAQTLAMSDQIPLIGISAFEVLAEGSFRQTGLKKFYCLFDAGAQEIYAGWYVKNDLCGSWAALERPAAIPLQTAVEQMTLAMQADDNCGFAGDAVEKTELRACFDGLPLRKKGLVYPKIQDLLRLGIVAYTQKKWYSAYHELQPLYIARASTWRPSMA